MQGATFTSHPPARVLYRKSDEPTINWKMSNRTRGLEVRGRHGFGDGCARDFDLSHRSRPLSSLVRIADRTVIRFATGGFARDDSPAPSGDHFGELRSWLARATPRGALARGSRAGDAHERRGVLDGRGGVARGSLGFSRRRRRARLDRARRPRRPRNPPPRETAMPVFSNDRFPRGTRARARGRGGGRQARALARWR